MLVKNCHPLEEHFNDIDHTKNNKRMRTWKSHFCYPTEITNWCNESTANFLIAEVWLPTIEQERSRRGFSTLMGAFLHPLKSERVHDRNSLSLSYPNNDIDSVSRAFSIGMYSQNLMEPVFSKLDGHIVLVCSFLMDKKNGHILIINIVTK